jgi:glycosyltransferase involved in cell wall biosynthesis
MPVLVSVIIPLYNDAARLRACLDALSSQTIHQPYEILVVDNGSSDNPSAVVADYPLAALLTEERRGSYAARNRGVAEAKGEVLAFTDADCIPANDWLERGAAGVLQPGVPLCVGGRISVFPTTPDSRGVVELYQVLNGFPQQLYIERYSFSTTANMFVLADTFAAVGPFEDSLISSGDREWGQRAARAGVKLVYAGAVVVAHPARSSVTEMRKKARRVQAGELRLRVIAGEPLVWGELGRLALRPPLRSLLRDAMRFPTRNPAVFARYAALVLGLYYYRFYQRVRLALAARFAPVRGFTDDP